MTRLELKKLFLDNCKYFVISNPEWLLKSHNTPNGHECSWSIRIKRAVLKREGLINHNGDEHETSNSK